MPPFLGAGILFRILLRIGGPLLDRLGVLPPQWYLQEAVEAMSQDDIPQVIQALRSARKGSRQWELVRQQAVFRCRVLKEGHERSKERLSQLLMGAHRVGIGQESVEEAMGLHQRGIDILSGYESTLQGLVL